MAYEFKKLSEVLEVETANSTAKVLIEEEGIIKKVPKDEVGGLKEVDWEIITNKPKIVTSWNDLEDKPFGVKTEMVEIVPEQSVTGLDMSEGNPDVDPGVQLGGVLENAIAIEDGKKYIVSINGEKIELTAKNEDNSPPDMQFVSMGNDLLAGGLERPDTGEPIYILWTGTSCVAYWKYEIGETITLAIYEEQEVVKPLDPKFVSASGSAILNFSRDSDDSLNICDNTFDVFDNAYKNRKPINATFTEYTLNEHHIGYLSSYISWDDGSYVLTFRRLEGGSGFSYGLSKGRVVKQIRWYPDGRIEDYEIVA